MKTVGFADQMAPGDEEIAEAFTNKLFCRYV